MCCEIRNYVSRDEAQSVLKFQEVRENLFFVWQTPSSHSSPSAMGVVNVSKVRNKIKRQELYKSAKVEKSKAKLTQRKERAQAEKQDPKLKEVQPPSIFCCILITGTIKNKHPSYSWKSTRIRWDNHHRPQWPRFTRRFSEGWIRLFLLQCHCNFQTPHNHLSPPFIIGSNSHFRRRPPQCVSWLNFPSKRSYLSSPSNSSNRSRLTRIYRHASHQWGTKSKESWCNYAYSSPVWSVVSISCI